MGGKFENILPLQPLIQCVTISWWPKNWFCRWLFCDCRWSLTLMEASPQSGNGIWFILFHFVPLPFLDSRTLHQTPSLVDCCLRYQWNRLTLHCIVILPSWTASSLSNHVIPPPLAHCHHSRVLFRCVTIQYPVQNRQSQFVCRNVHHLSYRWPTHRWSFNQR